MFAGSSYSVPFSGNIVAVSAIWALKLNANVSTGTSIVQALFVSYSLACVRALEDVIKGNFNNVYILDYVFSLVSKPKKNQRLLKTIDNDIIKEKLVLKIKYSDYISNHDWVYDLTRRGFKIALEIDSSFEFSEENNKLFKIFAFIITSDRKLYDSSQYEIIYIPS